MMDKTVVKNEHNIRMVDTCSTCLFRGERVNACTVYCVEHDVFVNTRTICDKYRRTTNKHITKIDGMTVSRILEELNERE